VRWIFEQERANGCAVWVWCPNVTKPVFDSILFSDYCPGVACVD
jgi:hypothetical protein